MTSSCLFKWWSEISCKQHSSSWMFHIYTVKFSLHGLVMQNVSKHYKLSYHMSSLQLTHLLLKKPWYPWQVEIQMYMCCGSNTRWEFGAHACLAIWSGHKNIERFINWMLLLYFPWPVLPYLIKFTYKVGHMYIYIWYIWYEYDIYVYIHVSG